MRVLVCGDRNWEDNLTLCHDIETNIIKVILDGFAQNGECHNQDGAEAMVVIEGEAKGADIAARDWVWEDEPRTYCGCEVQLERYPANWDKFHKAAGPIRNKQMLDEGKPDIVLAFHDDLENSRGTGNMVKIASDAGVPVYNIRRIPPQSMATQTLDLK